MITPLVFKTTFRKFFSKLSYIYGLDLRALAIFRIGIAILTICDLINRSQSFLKFHTDWGVLPRSVAIDYYNSPWFWSFHFFGGNWFFQGFLFLLTFLVALQLLVGYRTKLAAIILWLLLISLQTRNPFVLHGGDVLWRVMFFWSLFLPLGATWSIDSIRRGEKLCEHHFSLGGLAFMGQLAIMYFLNGALKNAPEWVSEGTAGYYALHYDHFATSLGRWLGQFEQLCKVFTFSVLYLEKLGPLLFFVPVFPYYFRSIGVTFFVLFHLSLVFTMYLGLFPWVAILALLTLLPKPFWDKLCTNYLVQKFTQIFTPIYFLLKDRLLAQQSFKAPRKTSRKWSYTKLLCINLLVLSLLIYVIFWNLETLHRRHFLYTNFPFGKQIAYSLRLDQEWNMFAPKPSTDDGWYVIVGKLRNGQGTNVLLRNSEISYEKPKRIIDLYGTQREAKYMLTLWEARNADYRLYYGKYLCRSWNIGYKGGDTLETFEIIFMREDTLLNNREANPKEILLWSHDCF